MPGVLVKSKYCFIYLLLAAFMAVGPGPVSAFQSASDKRVSAWEKPIARCWALESEFLLDVAPIAEKGLMYIALAEGAIAAIDTTSGKQLWLSRLGGEVRKMTLTATGRLAVLTGQESEKKDASQALFVQMLSSETGVSVWRKELEFSGETLLDADKTRVNLTQFSDGRRLEFNLETGEQELATGAWLRRDGKGYRSFFIRKEDGKSSQLSDNLDISTDMAGNISAGPWKARVGAEVVDISLSGEGLVVSSADNFVYMLTTGHGDRKWKRRFSGRLLGAPVLADNYGLFVTVGGAEATILDLSNGKVVNSVSLVDGAFFTAGAVSAGSGFALFTSRGIIFYSPAGCAKS